MEYSHTMDELQLMFGRVCTDQPGEQRVSLLRKYLLFYLKCHVGYMRRPGQVVKTRYSCAEEVALFNGSLRNTEIMNCALPGMTPGNCFQNAFTASLSDPTLRYVEGWAYMEQSYPTHHAWVEHSDGTISDPTWYTVVSNRISDGGHGLIPGFKARGAYNRGKHTTEYSHKLVFGEKRHKFISQRGSPP